MDRCNIANMLFQKMSSLSRTAKYSVNVKGFNIMDQESIPVGCVAPASVTTTRCQYQGVGVDIQGYTHTLYTHPSH